MEQRLIDANELLRVVNDIPVYVYRDFYNFACAVIDAPTIEAEPVKHGKWIDAYPEIEPNPMFAYGICSECGFEQSISNKLNYCPNCGADMRGE